MPRITSYNVCYTKLLRSDQQDLVEHFGVFDLSRIDFAINFLKEYATPGKKLDTILAGGRLILSEEESKKRIKDFSEVAEKVVRDCELAEELLVKDKNEIDT